MNLRNSTIVLSILLGHFLLQCTGAVACVQRQTSMLPPAGVPDELPEQLKCLQQNKMTAAELPALAARGSGFVAMTCVQVDAACWSDAARHPWENGVPINSFRRGQ